MDELLRQLLGYVRGMWQYRWVGLVTAWLVGIAGTVMVFMTPNKYEASARIFVDTDSVLRPLMSGLAIQPNVEQQISILSRTLINRPNVEKVIRMADLDLNVKSKQEKERLIDQLVGAIKITRASVGTNLYNISIQDGSPDRAKRIVQSFVTLFVESGVVDKRRDADSARRFIEEQIQSYERKLQEAEGKLKEFKLKNLAIDQEFGRDYFTRMVELTNQVKQSKLELREAENSRDALQRQVSEEAATLQPDGPAEPVEIAVPELDGRISALKRNLDEMLRKYTDQHPDVVGTRRVIAQLEEQKRKEIQALKAAAKPGAAPGRQVNPIYQQLKMALAESEANVASLRSRVSEYESRLAQLKSRAQMQPQIEAEFVQLNRDYEVHKRNYDQLVTRRESASLSSEMDATGVAEFKLIDPPRASPKPVAPNRPLLVSGAFAIALAAGFGVCFVLSQVRPVFRDGRGLREAMGLPVLGSITRLQTEKDVRHVRRGVLAFLGGVLGFVACYGAAFGVLMMGTRG